MVHMADRPSDIPPEVSSAVEDLVLSGDTTNELDVSLRVSHPRAVLASLVDMFESHPEQESIISHLLGEIGGSAALPLLEQVIYDESFDDYTKRNAIACMCSWTESLPLLGRIVADVTNCSLEVRKEAAGTIQDVLSHEVQMQELTDESDDNWS